MILANQGLSEKGQCLYLEYLYQDLSASCYDACCIPLFKQQGPQLLLDHKHTMGYFLVASTHVPLTVIGASC